MVYDRNSSCLIDVAAVGVIAAIDVVVVLLLLILFSSIRGCVSMARFNPFFKDPTDHSFVSRKLTTYSGEI